MLGLFLQNHLISALRGFGPFLQDSTSCFTFDSNAMKMILDQQEIDDACNLFGVNKQDYHLSVDPELPHAIYFHWTATAQELTKMIKQQLGCVDVHIEGQWTDLQDVEDHYAFNRLVPCRYILTTT
jgi:hypothetical protein